MSAEDGEQVVTVEVDVKAEDETPDGGVQPAESEPAAGTEETTANGETAAATEETTANGETAAAAATDEQQQEAGGDAGGEDSGTEDAVEANGTSTNHLRGKRKRSI